MKQANPQNVLGIVLDHNGLQGKIVQGDLASLSTGNRVLVHFQNGEVVSVPAELLRLDRDGTYHLSVTLQELLSGDQDFVEDVEDAESLVIPVTEERISVQKQVRETGLVEIHKTTHERVETVNPALTSQEVEIERIAINRMVDQPIPIRYEGDTMIISLLEEVLVVEKRLMLREEVHVKKLSKEVFDPQEVLLREERVEIARRAADQAQSHNPS